MTTRTLHVDASLGCAGDMLLAALVGVGADTGAVTAAIAAVVPESSVTFEPVARSGLAATAARVTLRADHESPSDRTWARIRALLAEADLTPAVSERSQAVFERLALAEAGVHGTPPEHVHFHEVGAMDALTDVVGVVAAVDSLAPGTVTCGPIGVGSGTARTEHGLLPVPAPAVLQLLAGTAAVVHPGPAAFEACTPTAAALLATLVDKWVPGPTGSIVRVGVGAGSRDPAGHPNVVRVMELAGSQPGVGLPGAAPPAAGAVVLETNVDDLDPRVWPSVQQALLAAGASDAWLTAIHMKKGRPAHTLSVLCSPELTDVIAEQVMRTTTAIGLRLLPVGKVAADRQIHTVMVGTEPIDIKVATWRGRVVNVQPEWEHVARAAGNLGLPSKQILALAHGQAAHLWPDPPSDSVVRDSSHP